jgi:hypothetical protein
MDTSRNEISNRNDRETGARKFPADPREHDRDKAGLEAAENESHGLTEPQGDHPQETLKSDSRDWPDGPVATTEQTGDPSEGPQNRPPQMPPHAPADRTSGAKTD